jgi:hypothetical protein
VLGHALERHIRRAGAPEAVQGAVARQPGQVGRRPPDRADRVGILAALLDDLAQRLLGGVLGIVGREAQGGLQRPAQAVGDDARVGSRGRTVAAGGQGGDEAVRRGIEALQV